MNVALDLGSNWFRSLRVDGTRLVSRRSRAVFATLPDATAQRGLLVPVVQRSISMLLLRDLGMTQKPLEFTCNAMEETLAEKVLGFLRRSSRTLSNQDGDGRLVRHIHDVHILVGMKPNLIATHRAFKLAVEEDVRKFANQDPTFSQNPKFILETTLQNAGSDSQLKVSYLKFVEDLVAGDAPDFDAAFSTFTLLAGKLIASLD